MFCRKCDNQGVDRIVETAFGAEHTGCFRCLRIGSDEPTTSECLAEPRLSRPIPPDLGEHRCQHDWDDLGAPGQFIDRPKATIVTIGGDQRPGIEDQRKGPNRRRARASSRSVISPCSRSNDETASAMDLSASFCSAASFSHDETETPSSLAATSTAANTSSFSPTDRFVTVLTGSILSRCYRREQRHSGVELS